MTALAPSATATIPAQVDELERAALAALSPAAAAYVAGGAGGEGTQRANRAAFERWMIVPRVLRDVSRRSLGVTLFDQRLPAPVLLAPVGLQGVFHPEGDLAGARAAARLGLPFVLSTVSSQSIEQVAAAMGTAPRWFQLYWPAADELAASFLHRAEAAGYSAIVVTVDTPVLGWREREIDHHSPLDTAEGMANFLTDPVFAARLGAAADSAARLRARTEQFPNPRPTWSDLEALRRHTRLPLLLKGVQHPGDAARALAAGVDGLIVSNHGGRQVDGAMAALDALPGVVDAVAGRIPVLFDSGIRRGADIVKALALGAKAVFVGRLYIWGMALGGEAGVAAVLNHLLADFDRTLANAGYADPAELQRSALAATPR